MKQLIVCSLLLVPGLVFGQGGGLEPSEILKPLAAGKGTGL